MPESTFPYHLTLPLTLPLTLSLTLSLTLAPGARERGGAPRPTLNTLTLTLSLTLSLTLELGPTLTVERGP